MEHVTGNPRPGAYAARVVHELRQWPTLAARETRRGVTFAVRGTQILHLSGHDEMRLRLTAPVIGRLSPHLWDSGHVRACPDQAWVAVQLESEPDLELFLALTSVAIKANATGRWRNHGRDLGGLCPEARPSREQPIRGLCHRKAD